MIKWLFSRVWRRRLRGRKLVRVTGWRSCVCEEFGARERVRFCLGRADEPRFDLQIIVAKLEKLGCRLVTIKLTDCDPTHEQIEALRRSLGPDEWVVEYRKGLVLQRGADG